MATTESVVGVEPGTRPYPDLKWVAIDFDGTIAMPKWTPDNPTREAGPPLPGVRDKLNELVREGYKPIIHTSRGWTDYEYIEAYCEHYGLPVRRIVCGKILAAKYIDDLNGNVNDDSWLPSLGNGQQDKVTAQEGAAGRDFT